MRKTALLLARRQHGLRKSALATLSFLLVACSRRASEKAPELNEPPHITPTVSPAPMRAPPPAPLLAERDLARVGNPKPGPDKVDVQDVAMGTNVHFVAYTNDQVDAGQVRSAIDRALREINWLAAKLSEWRNDSEVSNINLHPAHWVKVGPDTFAVIRRGLEAGRASEGAFDITFQVMSDVWKFGSAAEAEPRVPSKSEIEQRRRFVDYRKVELDAGAQAVRIPNGYQLGLGGI